jgi:peptidoglycan/LPS O-acetylase OafA/YrhL
MIGLVAFLLYFTSTTGQSAYLPNYSLFFFAGLITSRFTWKPDTRLALLLVGVAFGLMVMCILIPFTRSLFMTGRFTGSLSEYNMHANVVMALLCLPYAMATVEHRLVDKHAQTIDRHLANITYIVYLIHRIAIYLLDTFAGGLTHVHQLPWIAASWIAVFIIALVIYRLVDRPIDARRHKFVEARQLVHSNVNLQG